MKKNSNPINTIERKHFNTMNNFKEKQKKEEIFQDTKAITLIALVITIIVLLILAAITINALFSNNGIIKQAQEAQTRYKIAQIEEELRLKLLGETVNLAIGNSNNDLDKILNIVGVNYIQEMQSLKTNEYDSKINCIIQIKEELYEIELESKESQGIEVKIIKKVDNIPEEAKVFYLLLLDPENNEVKKENIFPDLLCYYYNESHYIEMIEESKDENYNIYKMYIKNIGFVMGINKITEKSLIKETRIVTEKVNLDIIVKKDSKYYQSNIILTKGDIEYTIKNIIPQVPNESKLLLKIINGDMEGVEESVDGYYLYQEGIYLKIENTNTEGTYQYDTIYCEKKAQLIPMKIKVNSGADGTVNLPITSKIGLKVDWGDKTINSLSKHTYTQLNTEFIITISGMITEIYNSRSIISIEDWGETCLENIDLGWSSNLKSIASPRENSFKYITKFAGSFENCTALTSIPEDLFANCNNVTSFAGTFSKCTALTSIPENLFANCNNVTSFTATFLGCTSLQGNVPELWKRVSNGAENGYIGIPDGRGCFNACTKLSNYNLIPDYWKAEIVIAQ